MCNCTTIVEITPKRLTISKIRFVQENYSVIGFQNSQKESLFNKNRIRIGKKILEMFTTSTCKLLNRTILLGLESQNFSLLKNVIVSLLVKYLFVGSLKKTR